MSQGKHTGASRCPTVTIAIPCYEMHGRGAECLEHALASVEMQTYPHVDIVVSDHSVDEAVAKVCADWAAKLPLSYVRNSEQRGSSSANANLAIRQASGELVKILCQDDYLFDETSIACIVSAFPPERSWLVSSYLHTYDRRTLFGRQDPRLNRRIATVNTIGTHSCLTLRNRPDRPLFDERLIWFMDCEYYRRLYDAYGRPAILHIPTAVQLLWEGQVTHTSAASAELRRDELRYVEERHSPIRERLEPPLAGALRRAATVSARLPRWRGRAGREQR